MSPNMIKSGSNVTISINNDTNEVTINAKDTTYNMVSKTANGLMYASDKDKLDNIAPLANNYSLPTASSSTLGGVKIGSNISNSSGTISLTKANVINALEHTPLSAYNPSGYDLDKCYDAGLYMISSGTNYPSGKPFGSLLSLPYRKATGNEIQDFGTQIFIPNGDDSTKPNSMFYRTSLGTSWNDWQEVATKSYVSSTYLPLSGGTISGNLNVTGTLQTGGINCAVLGKGTNGLYN